MNGLVTSSFYPLMFQTKVENKMQYLSAVCMRCMGNKRTICRFCARPWDGSSLQMGTMYSYDIFAHVTCCKKRSAVRITVMDSLS